VTSIVASEEVTHMIDPETPPEPTILVELPPAETPQEDEEPADE
jgi:hypothetical protein